MRSLMPPMRMTLEMSLALIEDDELVEITVLHRSACEGAILDQNERKKAERLAASLRLNGAVIPVTFG